MAWSDQGVGVVVVFDCVCVLTLYGRAFVCVRVLCMCVCCLSCSIEGLWNISGGRWGCVFMS